MLPPKLLKVLNSKIESAQRDHPNVNKKPNPEFIRKFRLAFFDLIVDLFQNYKKRVTVLDGETIFETKSFIEDSDPAFKEFFVRYFQIDKHGSTSNNQMFNNFISTVSSRDDISEEERIMIEHVHSSIQIVQNEIDSSPSFKPQ